MPAKRVNKSQLKKQADQLASKYYRRKTPHCELASKDNVMCAGGLQWMHIITRSNLRLRYEAYNQLVGCQGHHWFYTNNPVDWVRFLERWFPDRLREAEAHRNELVKPDFEAWIAHFNQLT